MRMDLSHTWQKPSSTSDSAIAKLSPVSSESMKPTSSCSEPTGFGNTIWQSIGFPGKWNSDGVERNPVPWSGLSHMLCHPPPTGWSHFRRYLDNNTSTFSHPGGLELTWI